LQRVFVDLDHMKHHKERCVTCPVNEICGGFCPAANLSATGSLYTPHDAYCDWSNQMYAAAERQVSRLVDNEGAWQLLLKSIEGVRDDGQR